MSHDRPSQAALPQVATRAELEERLSARARPDMSRAPAPGPYERLEALRSSSQNNEQRISALTRSLDNADRNLNHDYLSASLKGRSRIDFEVSKTDRERER